MSENILISVLLPAKDLPHLINHVINMVRLQTYQHIQLIVIDQDPINQSAKINLHHPGIEYIWLPGSTELEALREGLKSAKGDYIVPLNLQDQWYPSYIQNIINKIQSDPIDLIISNGLIQNIDLSLKDFITIDQKIRMGLNADSEDKWIDCDANKTEIIFRKFPILTPTSFIYKRKFFEKNLPVKGEGSILTNVALLTINESKIRIALYLGNGWIRRYDANNFNKNQKEYIIKKTRHLSFFKNEFKKLKPVPPTKIQYLIKKRIRAEYKSLLSQCKKSNLYYLQAKIIYQMFLLKPKNFFSHN